VEVDVTSARLARIGWVRLKERGYIPAGRKIVWATIIERYGRWFLAVSCEFPACSPAPNGKPSVGVDLGVKTFAVLSTGQSFVAPRPLARLEGRTRILNKKLERSKKGGRNRAKLIARIGNAHRRAYNARADFLHKLTTHLAKNHGLVAIEDLCVEGMLKNRSLGRHVADARFAEFRHMLEYKTRKYGSRLAVASRTYPSSKRCSACGRVKNRLALSDREYACDSCGLKMDRDLNAAINILVAASSAETQNACRAISSLAMKQEPGSIALAGA